MAPERSGSGTRVVSGCLQSSLCYDCIYDYTVSTGYIHAYGGSHSTSDPEQTFYGVLITYGAWSLILIVLLLRSRWTKRPSLQAAMFLLLIAFVLVCVELPTHLHDHLPSAVVALQRLATPLLFLTVFMELKSGSISKLVFYPVLGSYAILNIAHLILNFLVDPHAIGLGRRNSEGDELDLIIDQDKLHKLDADVKIGLAADFLALALAVFIWVSIGISSFRRTTPRAESIWILAAATGLVQATLFEVIVATRFTLWNLHVTMGVEQCSDYVNPPYRDTVDGFPVVEAVLGPLGFVLACAAIVELQRK